MKKKIYQQEKIVSEWMNQFKKVSWETEAAPKKLPSPESIWENATLSYTPYSSLVKKALRPLLISRVLAYTIITAGIIASLLSFKQELKHFLSVSFNFEVSLPLVLTFIIPMIFVCSLTILGILANTLEKRKSGQLSL